MARNRTSEQKRIAKGKPFLTEGDAHRFTRYRSSAAKLIDRDAFMKSSLSEGQIYFMRFVGVQTEKRWIIDDRYRDWSTDEYSLRANLRRRYAEGSRRIKALARL